ASATHILLLATAILAVLDQILTPTMKTQDVNHTNQRNASWQTGPLPIKGVMAKGENISDDRLPTLGNREISLCIIQQHRERSAKGVFLNDK
ncbi:MAG TPA: hypothetical protein VGB45_03510, partial [Abditibacterium sp.]